MCFILNLGMNDFLLLFRFTIDDRPPPYNFNSYETDTISSSDGYSPPTPPVWESDWLWELEGPSTNNPFWNSRDSKSYFEADNLGYI